MSCNAIDARWLCIISTCTGCGVDIDRKTLFWSRNGALIGSRSVDVLVRPFFALVGLKSPAAEVRIQLQQTKFVFNLNDYVMSQVGDAPVPAVLPGLNMQQQQQQQQSWKQDIQEPDSQEFVGEGKVTEDPQDDESLDYTGKDRIEYQKYTFLPEVGEDLILGDAEDEFAVRWGEHRASSTQIALIQSHVPLQPLHPDGRIGEVLVLGRPVHIWRSHLPIFFISLLSSPSHSLARTDESGRRRRLYFEVELDRTESKLQDDAPSFAVGWSNRSLLRSEEPVTQLPGAQAGTWALHGTGMKFGEGVGSDYTHTLVGPLVLGCGLDLDSRQAFFTLNGTHLGTAFRGMGSPVSSNRDEGEDEEKGDENAEEEWWAIIGLRMSPCRASVRLVPPFSYMGAFEILSSVAEGDGGDANELELVRPLQLQRTVSSENRELRTQLEQLEDEKTCVVCCAEARDAVFLPCAHLVSCITCAVTVKECPMCRKEVTSHLRVFSS